MRLALRDVWAAPPGVAEPVVRGVSLDLAAGDWIALGGENGGGKTTLLLVAAGLLAPRRGARELPAAGGAAPRVATILQDPSVQLLAPTVADEIALTARHLALDPVTTREDVERWSRALGLTEDLERAPQALSAGRQQLVLLAAALVSRPDLLVADEAGAHLDAEARARVLGALEAERTRGMAILWATQEPAERAAARSALELRRRPDGSSALEPVASAPEPSGIPGDPAAAAIPAAQRCPEGGDPAPGLRLRVHPAAEGEGPRIRTSRGFELVMGSRGVTALTGPNGAGKSVLLMSACGLLELPQVERRPDPAAQPPIFLGQYPERQIFEETVAAESVFAAVARGVGREEAARRVARLFESLGVGHLLRDRRRTWELSAGERRLVLLVGAMAAPAGLFALDEPTAGLDPARRERLLEEVRRLAESAPVLVASQDAGWLARLGGRVLPLGSP